MPCNVPASTPIGPLRHPSPAAPRLPRAGPRSRGGVAARTPCWRRSAARWRRRATPPPRSTTSCAARACRRRPSTDTSPTRRTASSLPTRRPARSCSARSPESHGAADDWLGRTRAGIAAYLRWLAAEPALARVFLIEVAAAGPTHGGSPRAPARRLRAAASRSARRRRGRELAPSLPSLPPRKSSRPWWRRWTRWWCGASAPAPARSWEKLEPILLYLQVALLAGPQAAAELDSGLSSIVGRGLAAHAALDQRLTLSLAPRLRMRPIWGSRRPSASAAASSVRSRTPLPWRSSSSNTRIP